MPEFALHLLGAGLLVVGFVVLLSKLRVIERAREIHQTAISALDILADPAMDELAKEKSMQRMAAQLFKQFFLITAGGSMALFAPLAVIWVADLGGLVSFAGVVSVSLSWYFLVGVTIVGFAVFGVALRRDAKPSEGFENRYSAMDRLLHQVAFATRPVQVLLSAMEDRLLGKQLQLARDQQDAPVFITALPRAGTTLLLDLCNNLAEFTSHSYRHMPFVLTPLLWDRFSALFRVEGTTRERAHGDGVMVGFDSPEAFEEILWMHFWPDHYQRGSIKPWDDSVEGNAFFDFFSRHRRKIMALGDGGRGGQRYISKNNLNIARVPLLINAIPDSVVLIPFRDPYQHAASLLHQHLGFMRMHVDDPFAALYMKGIGHFDFGENLKPVDFGHWIASFPDLDPTKLSFWLRYWCVTYEHLLKQQSERVRFCDFDALCSNPGATMERIGEFLQIENREAFVAQASRVHAPRHHSVPSEARRSLEGGSVNSVYRQLRESAL
jgi:hypothetical protein